MVASLSPALKPVLYDQATGVLARLGAGAEAANAEPAGNRPAGKPNLLWLLAFDGRAISTYHQIPTLCISAYRAGEKAAMIEFDSLPIVDSLNPTMRLIFFNEDTGELVQLGSP